MSVWKSDETLLSICILNFSFKNDFVWEEISNIRHSVSSPDETLHLMFDILLNILRRIFLNWAVPERRDKVWKDTNYFFQRRFHSLITWIARNGHLTKKPDAQRKRTQPCWPKTPNIQNIEGCYILRPFAHPVACCCATFESGQTFIRPTMSGVVASVCS